MSIIDAVKAKYSVDPKRVFVLGHSNGGFMSYRMACDHADTIAAIASLAGATFDDPSMCKPSEHVSVLQIHGTADQTIKYTGDQIIGHTYPGAEKSVATWAKYDGCTGTLGITGNIRLQQTEHSSRESSAAGRLWPTPLPLAGVRVGRSGPADAGARRQQRGEARHCE